MEKNDYVMFADSVLLVDVESRKDKAEEKRVELHCHTNMSDMDGVNDIRDIMDRAAEWGHKALAITDHGVVQAFTDAFHHVQNKKIDDIKIFISMILNLEIK